MLRSGWRPLPVSTGAYSALLPSVISSLTWFSISGSLMALRVLVVVVAEVRGVVMVAVDLAFGDGRAAFAEQRERRVPAGAVPLVAPLAGDGGQRLQDDAVG